MAEVRKILGQADLSATTLTDVYAVPAGLQAVVSTVVVTNRNNASRSFRISAAVGGIVDSAKQYLYYDVTIPPYETFCSTIGITLNSGDVVRAYASGTGLSVNLFGVEIN